MLDLRELWACGLGGLRALLEDQDEETGVRSSSVSSASDIFSDLYLGITTGCYFRMRGSQYARNVYEQVLYHVLVRLLSRSRLLQVKLTR